MLDNIKEWVMGLLLKKYALGLVVKAWDFADGYRTQISMASAIAALVSGHLGYMPMDKANEMALTLGGTAMATFLEKLRKYDGLIVKVSDLVKEARAEKAAQVPPAAQPPTP